MITTDYNENQFFSGLATALAVHGINKEASWLIDFEYIRNDDGTYTITAWKGTYKGQPSTKCIIPNNRLVVLNLDGGE